MSLPCRREEQGVPPAAIGHGFTEFIEVGPGDFLGAPDANVVCAVRALAATAMIHKQVKCAVVTDDIRGFALIGDDGDGGIGGEAAAGLGIELNQFDIAVIGAVAEPEGAIGREAGAGINGVQRFSFAGMNDHAAILSTEADTLVVSKVGLVIRPTAETKEPHFETA